jgi:1-phosphofructokinase family hexose kinase
MILNVTLNPCLDKTLTVPDWKPGDSVRGREIRTVVGGKGNNVARALKRLGRGARPVTFLGGPTGQLCEALLRADDGLDPLIARTAAETRTILTVRTEGSPAQTAFFDPDPVISAAEAAALAELVENALADRSVEALTLSGSSPSEATHGLYSDLIGLARARRVPVFLDTYGPALAGIWGFWPTAIQLNRREAAIHLRKEAPTDADLLGLLDRWARHGVLLGVITDGPGAVLAQHRGLRFRAQPPAVDAVNPIGSGDCLLAGAVDAWLSNPEHDAEALLRHAVGCAVANALTWDAGAFDPDEAKRRARDVVIEPLARA